MLLIALTSLKVAREKSMPIVITSYGIEVTGGVWRAVVFVRCEELLNVARRNCVAESLEH